MTIITYARMHGSAGDFSTAFGGHPAELIIPSSRPSLMKTTRPNIRLDTTRSHSVVRKIPPRDGGEKPWSSFMSSRIISMEKDQSQFINQRMSHLFRDSNPLERLSGHARYQEPKKQSP